MQLMPGKDSGSEIALTAFITDPHHTTAKSPLLFCIHICLSDAILHRVRALLALLLPVLPTAETQ